MYKLRAYKRHITVVEFLPKDNFRFYFVLFLCRPNTGRSPFEEEKTDLLHKYNRISLEDAGKGDGPSQVTYCIYHQEAV